MGSSFKSFFIGAGSQNSSPVSSPANFQTSSADDDSIGLAGSPGCGVTEGPAKKPGRVVRTVPGRVTKTRSSGDAADKILKHSGGKPRLKTVLNDHGGMSFGRMGDNEAGPTLIRNDKRSLAKRLASKKAAEAAAAAAASAVTPALSPSTQSATPSPPMDGNSGMLDRSPCSSPISTSPIPPVGNNQANATLISGNDISIIDAQNSV